MSDSAPIDRLASMWGIHEDFYDIAGRHYVIPAETKVALLRAMGLPLDGGQDAGPLLDREVASAWSRILPPVVVAREDRPIRVSVILPDERSGEELTWLLREEGGAERSGTFRPADLPAEESREIGGRRLTRRSLSLSLAGPLRWGYHELSISGREGTLDSMPLAVSPLSCFLPAAIAGENRTWGITVQLYSLRSDRNWGIGDFTDLKQLIDRCAEIGAEMIGLNPLHALFPHNPWAISPYSPSSRIWKNAIYVDVEAVPEFQECLEAQEEVASPEFQKRLEELRREELVDYGGVVDAKRRILERLYSHFREKHLAAGSPRGRAFRGFLERGGVSLRSHALYEALQEHFHAGDPEIWGWQVWPVAYRHPATKEVAQFAEEHEERVQFFAWLQWITDEQLGEAGARCERWRLGIGLCEDLAVGVDPAGAEAWANQEQIVLGVAIGAPPDPVNPAGQDWGIPPLHPVEMRRSGYRLFVEMLRANMKHAGALRIDHILGMMRQYWVPKGLGAAHGSYVDFPFEEILGLIALESRRNHCLVIGEDLGTIPPGLREALMERSVLSYRLLYFENDEGGNPRRIEEYPHNAAVAISTHDLPTLAGFWEGRDLFWLGEAGLFPDDQARGARVMERNQQRTRLLLALEREGLLPSGVNVESSSAAELSVDLAVALHRYLARARSRLLLVQLSDLVGMAEPFNFPAAGNRYPNWRRKLPVSVDEVGRGELAQRLAGMLREERPRPDPGGSGGGGAESPSGPDIPRATYRLQFHKDFTFRSAIEVIPYLRDLGISHCYASPYLMARPGSMHGYDVVDHGSLNPEIGSEEDYERFVEALHANGMGQILDVVPNHMGVGPDNLWWLEVLENGQCSPFARFFDIDWLPMKDELRGKVLLPVLGDRYGTVLERGQLKLAFDPERGAIEVRYYENRFPIDPKRYPEILSGDLESLRDRLGPQDASLPEFESLIGAFHHLPDRWRSDREAVLERTRDKEIHKRKLAELARRVPEIRAHVEAAVARVNGEPGKAESFERLHRLLEEQTYRLAYWRVATDEINYRRFFDVNELAGLRMEVPEVFDLTHRRILQWIGEGKIQGLRIDHPDGLRDPAAYFARLQARAAGRDPDAGGREAPEVEARAERGTRAEGGTSATAPLGAMAPASGRPSPSLYLVIEKILGSREQLREDWEVHGTTGYEFLNLVNGLFVLPEAERAMDRIYARFLGRRPDFGEILYQSKKLIMRTALASELVVLANLLDRISESDRMTRDFTLNTLQEAIVETVACFPVYRTYVTSERVTPEDRRYVDWAIAQAKRRSPASDLTIFDFLRDVLLLEPSAGRDGDDRQARVDFAMKFQQYTAPVMAKGLEDTSFYRYHRLISLNEVGGDPRRFSTSPGVLHRANFERLRRWPHSMLSSSTHDSKRSEDVRARTNVLTELPEEWRKRLAVFSRLNRSRKMLIEGDPAPDRNDEYLLYQTLVGAWPLEAMGEGGPDDQALAAFRERIIQYMQKAIKEAKVHTSWINPNAEYEQATTKFVTAMLRRETGERFLSEIVPFARKISWFGMYNALSQTLLKALSPGVPDFYQGSVVWDFTLVDPDNRRPVDYEQRRRMIDELREVSAAADRPEGAAALARSLLDTLEDGRAKQYLILRCLSLRKERPALFQAGAYLSLDPRGDRENHLFAFARHDGEDWAIVIAPRFFSILLEGQRKLPLGDAVYGETWILLPPEAPGGPLRNLFTGEAVEIRTLPDGTRAVGAGSALVDFPVAVLTSPRRLEA